MLLRDKNTEILNWYHPLPTTTTTTPPGVTHHYHDYPVSLRMHAPSLSCDPEHQGVSLTCVGAHGFAQAQGAQAVSDPDARFTLLYCSRCYIVPLKHSLVAPLVWIFSESTLENSTDSSYCQAVASTTISKIKNSNDSKENRFVYTIGVSPYSCQPCTTRHTYNVLAWLVAAGAAWCLLVSTTTLVPVPECCC